MVQEGFTNYVFLATFLAKLILSSYRIKNEWSEDIIGSSVILLINTEYVQQYCGKQAIKQRQLLVKHITHTVAHNIQDPSHLAVKKTVEYDAKGIYDCEIHFKNGLPINSKSSCHYRYNFLLFE